MFNALILTLFPEMFPGPLGHSLAGKALKNYMRQETIMHSLKEVHLISQKGVQRLGIVNYPQGNMTQY